ncbi:hypothetical protein [Arthrobacter sp. HMWF013]|uniref:hypothetical protein n=1 Tax=Arthrobacter sp. HMWF013 TaxID=2056849 RepID=UPI000D335EAA|nr:hypothetical protein [Arthrobacter sp. HMWF013]PTT69628.1 hypothetical protein DBR22_03305 [Arthrobacter sp. HMWF013]
MTHGRPQASIRHLKLDEKGNFIDPDRNGKVVPDAAEDEKKSAMERYAGQKIQEHGKKEALRVVEANAIRLTAELRNPFWRVSIAIKDLPDRKGLLDSILEWLFTRRRKR